MITSEQLQQILTRISQGNERIEDLEALNETLLSGEKLTFQVGKNVVNIGKGEGIQIGDKHIYQGSDLKTIQESFRLELQKAFSLEPELSPIEVSEAICDFLKDVEKKFKDLKLFHVAQTVELEDQYVPIQVTLERRYQKHSEDFRSYVEAEEDTKRLYAMKGDLEKFERSQVDWQVAKKDHKQIIVLADPGMGKSTLLRMEAGKTAKEQREKLEGLLALDIKNEEEILKAIDVVVLPIYLRLSDLAKESGTLLEIISRLLRIYYLETGEKIEKVLIEKLKKGQCLLLFDALDEVPNDKGQRQNLKNKILNPFIQSYSCPIICTSRIVGYGGLLDQAKEVEIVPFTTKQTEEYIEVWFKNAKKFLQNQEVSATSLINELKEKPQIQGLVQNPLLLSLVCSLAQTKDIQLPARRTQIYEQAVDKMLNKWGIENERPSLDNDEEEPFKKIEQENLLRYIAYHFSCQQEVTEIFSKTDLLKVISEFSKKDNLSSDRCNQIFNELTNEHGIIQQLSDNRNEYLFLHRTFQEYLTASYINEKINIKGNQEAGIALVKEHLWQFDWHETISLVAGLMTDPIPLLEAITQEEDDIFNTLLLLAGLCLSECPNIDHPLVTEIVDKIAGFWQSYPKTGIETVLVTIGKIGNDKAVEALIKALD
ncbi:MAG: NACHT domain-containing protein, partial [Pseudanabaena sp. M074S1SP2A07QC]|nr:NACHT domain-containing protein [Pseudanabaena sp. M074S1SP2A07QC]